MVGLNPLGLEWNAIDELMLSGTREIDPDDLEIKETLGSGQFGVRKQNFLITLHINSNSIYSEAFIALL